jgi:hypothetical protein
MSLQKKDPWPMTINVESARVWPRCLHCDVKLVVSHLPGKVFLPLVMALLLHSLLTSAAGAERHRKMLVLYDENTDFPGLALLNRNLKAALNAGATDRIDLYTESMDLARFQDDRYMESSCTRFIARNTPTCGSIWSSLSWVLRWISCCDTASSCSPEHRWCSVGLAGMK